MAKKVYMAEENVVSGQVLYDIIENHYNTKVERFNYLYDLYKGRHEILDWIETDPNKPDNKLINNYYGEIVDTVVGYFLGNPIVINYEDGAVQEEIDNIFADNDIDDLFMEIGKEDSIKGTSALMVYQNEDSETQLVRIPAEEIIFVYDSSKINDLIYAIRVYEVSGEDDEVYRYAEVYGKESTQYWVEDKNVGMFVPDNDRDEEPHIFERVPIVEFPNNTEKMGDFEKIIALVSDFDKVFSNASNELEAFRHAYLMLKNMTANADAIQRLKEQGVIEVMENGDVKFVTKDIPDDFMNRHLDRLENNIYRFAQVPNLSDEKFAGNLSGVAIRFKLFGLETKCIGKERKFTKAIKELFKLLAVPIKIKTGKDIEINKMDIQFTRNVPNNLVELADVVSKLQGTVDKETLLGILPFIDDPKAVVEAMAEEQSSYEKDMEKFRSGGNANDQLGAVGGNEEQF